MKRWLACLLFLPVLLLAAKPVAAAPERASEVTRTVLPGADRIDARAWLPLSPLKLLTLLEAPCHVRRWMPALAHIEIIEQSSPDNTLVRMTTHAPWPLRPREATTRFARDIHDDGHIVITLHHVADHGSGVIAGRERHTAGAIRMPFYEGAWSLYPTDDGTLVTYYQRVSPGGNLPQWLADRYAVSYTRTIMEALERYATDNKSHADCVTAAEHAGERQ